MALPPPTIGQWKPGESGNPAGRPKGSKNLSQHIENMLNDPDFELKLRDGSMIKGAPIGAIIKAAIVKAIAGDMRAFDMLAKYGYGTKMDITSGGEKLELPQVYLPARKEVDDDHA